MIRYLPFVLILLAFTTIFGAIWDIWSHVMGFVETFWTPSHSVIYISVALTGLLVLFVVIFQSFKIGSFSPKRIHNVKGYAVSGMGSLFQLLAGVTDELYHEIFGFDVTMWSPPHVAVIFGAVLTMLGVYEMVEGEKKRLYKWFGTVLSLALAIVIMQIALIEYSIADTFSITDRWQPYNGYLSVLLSPVLVYSFLIGSKRLQKPVGTLIGGSAFLIHLIIYFWWNTTPVDYRSPIVLLISGLLFDIVYLIAKEKSWRDYCAGTAAILGLVIAQEIQNPLSIQWNSLVYTVLISFILGLIFAKFSGRMIRLKGIHLSAIVMILLIIPDTAQAHGEGEIAKLAPDLHPIAVLIEFLFIFFIGYFAAGKLANLNLGKTETSDLG